MNDQRLILHTRVVEGSGGGPDKTILNSPRYLSRGGYRALCAFMRHPEDSRFSEIEDRAVQWDAPLVGIDDTGPFDYRIPGRFLEVCQRVGPAIWHGHDYKSNLMGLIVGRSYPMHLVTTVHGWVKRTWKTPLYYALDRLCLRRYDQVVCVSTDLQRTVRNLGVSESRCSYIPNGVDTDEFRKVHPGSAQSSAGSRSPRRLVIGAAGRLSSEKGFDILIESIKALVSEGRDVELRIAGEGDQRASLEHQLQRSGIRERVALLGYQADVLQFFGDLDMFVVSSRREGLPNVLLEAMAMELPVVSTRVAGVGEGIRHLENGLLVEAGSVASLTGALRSLQTDEDLRARLGQEARRCVVESYSFAKRMERIMAVYGMCLAAERTSHRFKS